MMTARSNPQGMVEVQLPDPRGDGTLTVLLNRAQARGLAAKLIVAAGGRELEQRMGAVVAEVQEGVELVQETRQTFENVRRIANGAQKILRKYKRR